MLIALMLAPRQLGDVARQRLFHRIGIHGDRRIGCSLFGRTRTGRLALRLALLFRLAVLLRFALWLCRLRPLFALRAASLGVAAAATAATPAATASARRFVAFAERLGFDARNRDRRDRLADQLLDRL